MTLSLASGTYLKGMTVSTVVPYFNPQIAQYRVDKTYI